MKGDSLPLLLFWEIVFFSLFDDEIEKSIMSNIFPLFLFFVKANSVVDISMCSKTTFELHAFTERKVGSSLNNKMHATEFYFSTSLLLPYQ